MDVLCCRITIGDADPASPMKITDGVEITEVHTLEMRSLLEFQLVGHVLALDLQHALRVIAGDIAVEHVLHHAVVTEFNIDALPDLERRLIDQPLGRTLLDDDAVLHNLRRQS